MNNSKNYIESENITTWEREGYEEFSEIDNPTELKTAAQWLFSADNPDRVDIPKYSVTVSYAQRKDKEIRLGDIVTVIDRQYNITSKQRATEVRIYPFEPNKNEVTVMTLFLLHTNCQKKPTHRTYSKKRTLQNLHQQLIINQLLRNMSMMPSKRQSKSITQRQWHYSGRTNYECNNKNTRIE